MNTLSGLDHLLDSQELQKSIKGSIGYLCHSASVDRHLKLGIFGLQRVFGKRLKKVFSPQHGLFSDVQDNMVESQDFIHPFFNLQIHSLYSETRSPTPQMLEGIDTILVDLQDVGTRIYTYIYTMTLLMDQCRDRDIKVVILDRPNPVNGIDTEGPLLESDFTSFVGRHPLPVRHGLTIGEVAKMAHEHFGSTCQLEIIPLLHWQRGMSFEETGLPWVLPSPNLPTIEAAYTFVGTVIYEGTNISEGRGTTRSLEIIGHPGIEPFKFLSHLEHKFQTAGLTGFVLRPLVFLPTFQKHAGKACGGYQIHVTDRTKFKPWRVCQILLREFYHELGDQFAWKEPPYEYEYDRMPIDLINGTDTLRKWVEKNGSVEELNELEAQSLPKFLNKRQSCLLYPAS